MKKLSIVLGFFAVLGLFTVGCAANTGDEESADQSSEALTCPPGTVLSHRGTTCAAPLPGTVIVGGPVVGASPACPATNPCLRRRGTVCGPATNGVCL